MNQYPDEFIQYLIYFHTNRDYFECHEVLEEYWKRNSQSEMANTWVGLIQVAVSTYHHRRKNIKGANKMLEQALLNLSSIQLSKLGIDSNRFFELLHERKHLIEERPHAAYSDLAIPILDSDLMNLCMAKSAELALVWGQPSQMTDDRLIHKHTNRDRTQVIQSRLKELNRRHKSSKME